MSDLQLGLLVIGAIVVAGVFAYNRRQERAARRAAEGEFRSDHADVLLQPQRARIEPVLGERTQRGEERGAPGQAPALPDPRIDYVMELSFPSALAPSLLAEQWKENEHRYAARAILACSGGVAGWRRLSAGDGAPVEALRAGLQLVTREGAVNEAQLIEFRTAVETLAAATGASVDAPEIKQAVEAARELDQFCGDSDIQVVIHVEPAGEDLFSGERIRAMAEASGLALEQDGRFAQRDESGRPFYFLGARDGTRFDRPTVDAQAFSGISLALDVPRVPDLPRAFRSMAGFASRLAAELRGRMVDDNRNVLDARALEAIGAQLDTVRAAFEARGIQTGGPAALRLFS